MSCAGIENTSCRCLDRACGSGDGAACQRWLNFGPRAPAGVDQCLALPLIESGICDAELGDEVPDRLTASIRSQV